MNPWIYSLSFQKTLIKSLVPFSQTLVIFSFKIAQIAKLLTGISLNVSIVAELLPIITLINSATHFYIALKYHSEHFGCIQVFTSKPVAQLIV